MDCNEAKTKIDLYIDDLLDDSDKQRLIWHASSCPECKKALDDAVRLKQALAGLNEVEPPKGLAASAIKKAKRRRVPVWGYASAAVAAVVALVLAFSPAVLPNAKGTADSEERLMYAAPNEEMAQDFGEDIIPEMSMAAGADGTDELTGNMMETTPEVKTSCAGITAYVDRIYTSEADFLEGMRCEGVVYYYRPTEDALPEGAVLVQIEVTQDSVRWIYSYGTEEEPKTLAFEWYRTRTADDIAAWGEKTMAINDNLAASFIQTEGIFWSPEARFNADGEMEATDGTAINAYWSLDEGVFHAELPLEFSEPEIILATCIMEKVPVE